MDCNRQYLVHTLPLIVVGIVAGCKPESHPPLVVIRTFLRHVWGRRIHETLEAGVQRTAFSTPTIELGMPVLVRFHEGAYHIDGIYPLGHHFDDLCITAGFESQPIAHTHARRLVERFQRQYPGLPLTSLPDVPAKPVSHYQQIRRAALAQHARHGRSAHPKPHVA